MPITTELVNVHLEAIFPHSFEVAVKGLEREGVVAFTAAEQSCVQGEIMAILMRNQMVVAITKQKCTFCMAGVLTPPYRLFEFSRTTPDTSKKD